MVEQQPVHLAAEVLFTRTARLGARHRVNRSGSRSAWDHVERRLELAEAELFREVLDGDGSVADAALLVEEIVAAARHYDHIGRVAQTDGRRIDDQIQQVVGCACRVTHVRQAVPEDE